MKSLGSSISVLFRFLILFLIFVIPFSVLGYWVELKWGAIAGLGLGYAVFLWMLMRSEDGIAYAYHAVELSQVGFKRTFDRVIDEMGDSWDWRPRLLLFRDPSPALMVFRRPGSDGTILVSQGLISLVSEAELRWLFHYSVRRSRERGISLSTFSSYLSTLLFSTIPQKWSNLVFSDGKVLDQRDEKGLGVLSAIWFSMVYSALRFLAWLGRGSASIPLEHPQAIAAAQKINRALQLWGHFQMNGAFGSHLTHPISFNSLVNPCEQE